MNQGTDYPEFVEVDPTGRYGRYNEILGKGASKMVYRAFDEYEGIEVAWNQVKLHDFLQSPEELERLYCEIHLLKTLNHKNIMKFYTSWVDTSKRNINFVTELFTSGTLRQYRQKHGRVNIRAVKHWCRQILKGLLYLHGHDPPVIHRDLKCDNIFINGNQGQVKIGDLGLAAILRKSHAARCVGTPEFMAPEVYEEEYNELVDIYSFGMCVLEMVTYEYPYSECTHPAQIYKKVVSGTKPNVLYRVKDPEVRHFVEKCLATASKRLSAKELLKDPFLQIDDHASVCSEKDVSDMDLLYRQPFLDLFSSNGFLNGYINEFPRQTEIDNVWDYDAADISTHGMDLFNNHEDEQIANVDITIKGRRKEDGGIFLRLRIADKDGRKRNIYFPFDLETDTALSVATEMIAELDITDYEVTRIAELIDNEVSSLVPEWEPGPGISETPRFSPAGLCRNCKSNVSSCGSLLDYLSKTPGFGNIQSVHCLECAAMHGRFEEIRYQVDESEERCEMEGAPGNSTSQSDEDFDANDEKAGQMNCSRHGRMRKSMGDLDGNSNLQQDLDMPKLEGYQHSHTHLSDDYENEVRQELRWLKAKYQMELRDYKNRRLGGSRRVLHPSLDLQNRDRRLGSEIQACATTEIAPLQVSDENLTRKFHGDRIWEGRRVRDCDEGSPEFLTAKKFYAKEALLPNCLGGTKSLPVDAVDV